MTPATGTADAESMTRSIPIGAVPVDLRGAVAPPLVNDVEYHGQNVGETARIYFTELPDGLAVDTAEPAHYAAPGGSFWLRPVAGMTIWAWAATAQTLVVTES